jgi:hypothetical protein
MVVIAVATNPETKGVGNLNRPAAATIAATHLGTAVA